MVRFPSPPDMLTDGEDTMQNSTLAKIALTAAVAVAGVGFLVKSSLGSAPL